MNYFLDRYERYYVIRYRFDCSYINKIDFIELLNNLNNFSNFNMKIKSKTYKLFIIIL